METVEITALVGSAILEVKMLVVKWHNDEFHLAANVYPFGLEDQEWRTSITIKRRHNRNGALDPAEINWPALGAQTSDVANEFSKGLAAAVKVAYEMMSDVYIYKVVGMSRILAHDVEIFVLGNSFAQIHESVTNNVELGTATFTKVGLKS